MSDSVSNAMPFEGVSPILRVRSVRESLQYYVDVLGFNIDWGAESSGFASVSRGRCHLFLCEGDQGNFGTWVWIGAPHVEQVFEEYCQRGAKMRHPPTNYPWALEMQVEDLDGNVLRIGSEPKDNEPWGEWLDMHGNRWVMSGPDQWVRVSEKNAATES